MQMDARREDWFELLLHFSSAGEKRGKAKREDVGVLIVCSKKDHLLPFPSSFRSSALLHSGKGSNTWECMSNIIASNKSENFSMPLND